MRVGVNLLFCTPGRVGGSEEYLTRQLLGLAAVGADVDLRVYASGAYRDAHPELLAAHGDRLTALVPPVDTDRRPVRVALEHSWLAARSRADDLVHHGGGTVPQVGRRPTVLTVHDLQFLQYPEYVSPRKLRYLRTMLPRSVRRADVIATPSAFVRSTVIDAYDADPSRVLVVPHGVPSPSVSGRHDVDEVALRRRYGLGAGRVLVYPAITHPHKGHLLLLDVLARHWTDPDLRIVLLGGAGSAESEVSGRIAVLGLGDRVLRPGRVPAADRDALLAIADALVFPSQYEGFGAPLVEAMAVGTPIICSDHAAVREVVGDAAIVRPAADPDAWADALEELAARRDDLIEAGRARRAHFTVEVAGRAIEAAYRQALAA